MAPSTLGTFLRSQVYLADVLTRAGDPAHALEEYAAALEVFRRQGNITHAVTAVRNLIDLLAAIGDDRGATVLAGAVADDRLRASYGAEAERLAGRLTTVCRRVEEATFASWLDEGSRLGDDLVITAAAIVDQHR